MKYGRVVLDKTSQGGKNREPPPFFIMRFSNGRLILRLPMPPSQNAMYDEPLAQSPMMEDPSQELEKELAGRYA